MAALLFGLGIVGCLGGPARHAASPGGGGESSPDDGGADPAADLTPGVDAAGTADAGGTGGVIDIYVTGDRTPLAFDDGLAGQTPREFTIALSRYELLRPADDPAPVLCFDQGATPVVAELDRDNRVGACSTDAIPTGRYTHGRTRVDWARYTVDGAYHADGRTQAGPIVIFRAYSDVIVAGESFRAGQGTVTLPGGGRREHEFDDDELPVLPGVTFETRDGECVMTFPYTHPLPILQHAPGTHWARFHWQVADSFRWVEEERPGYAEGVWDVAELLGTEEVRVFGVGGYYITSSVD